MTGNDELMLGFEWNPHDPKGVTGKPVTFDLETSLTLIAPTGTGKGTTLEIPNLTLGLHNTSIVAIDPTGQNHAITAEARRKAGSKVICLNPMGLHLDMYPDMESVGCNPMLAGLDPKNASFYEDAVRIADAFDWSDGGDPFWPNAGRDVTAFFIGGVRVRDGNDANLSTVLDLLMEADDKDEEGLPCQGLSFRAAEFIVECGDNKNTKWIANLAGKYLDGPNKSAKTTDGIRQTAQTAARSLLSPRIQADLKKNGIDWAELTRTPTTVSMIVPAEDLDLHAIWLRLNLSSALNTIYREAGRGPVKVLFLLSEFFALKKLSAVQAGFGQARKYKVIFWPVLQDYQQLIQLYGQEGASTFIANSGCVIAFAPGENPTAKFLSDHSGETRRMKIGMSEGPSGEPTTVVNEQVEPLWSATEIRNIPRNHAFVWFYGASAPQPVYLPPYFKNPECMKLVRPDPYRRSMEQPASPVRAMQVQQTQSTPKRKGGVMRWIMKKALAAVVIWVFLIIISLVWIIASDAIQGRI